MNKNKGITLIALVITIIILLILAGIAIAQLSNNGLFDRTRIAKEKYKNSEDTENRSLTEYDEEITKYTRDTVTLSKEEYDKLKKDSSTIVVTGNTANSTTWVKACDYPSGCNKDNVYIKSFYIVMDDGVFDSSYNCMALQLRDDGIYFWTDATNRKSKTIKVFLGQI